MSSKYILSYQNFILNEKLTLSQSRKYIKAWYRSKANKIYEDYFEGKNRLFFPLNSTSIDDEMELESSTVEPLISNFLNSNGYEIIDYKAGLCNKKGDTKNQTKIGKVLNKLNNKALLRQFETDKFRSTVNLDDIKMWVVISRHPYDIAGMSTDRGWTSCMNLEDGEYNKYVLYDVTEGSIIAYLVKDDDLNINNPVSRILIKPFVNVDNEKDFVLFPENVMYGTEVPKFKKFTEDWCNNFNERNGKKTGRYLLNCKLYQDTVSTKLLGELAEKIPDTKEEVERYLNIFEVENYTIHDDLTVDVFGDVDLAENGFPRIPFKFGVIHGYLDLSYNDLGSLEGCPKEVKGDFDCSNNRLTNLNFGPEKVFGEYRVVNNLLTDIKGCASFIEGDLMLFKNRIKSLEGCPETLDKNLDCSSNSLIDLKGSPKTVKGLFDCSNNHLKTLEGAPENTGKFICSNNYITNLIGAPKYVNGDFYCNVNDRLTSIEGIPPMIMGEFSCVDTQIKTTVDEVKKLSSIKGKIRV